MSLGDCFPSDVKHASAVRNVAAGVVIKLQAVFDTGDVLEKRLLIIHVADQTIVCVINSKVAVFIQKSEVLSSCQVTIDRASHPFMDWDSHIDCSKVKVFDTAGVIVQIADHPEWVLGRITTAVRDQVLAAIKRSPVIAPIDVGVYTASLDAIQF
jgi:hypothetical protein